MSLFSRFITTWKHARFPWRTRFYVGSDHLGNDYYESTRKINGRTKRMVEIKGKQDDIFDFFSNEIPVQWNSWLRHTRYDSPTIEEIVLANKRRDLIIERAKKLDQEYEERKANDDLMKSQQESKPETEGDKKREFLFRPPTIPSDDFEPETWNPAFKKK
ncbi:hypothetical protein RhiirA5_267315 [Rhizophagus irregularis]|uniref:NADH dehydrogenase [ubiquinone] 1 alpha subcomplex subunit n=3 Tax=Rhizophagus irregularis TaxID=588596 RepID=A0A2I1E040_9GLOM|nr:hypothetical protein GLOIN_2v1514913 [Rhizophagus irregularis DAOM 181602=DAOM 197198]EXX57119.1 hypothetical protein RirG_210000 [Rhizophagus irregularis DAOM 197198w]PKC16043.1 hypothetical protein RhiirA5_267315 [Rhizophagus irregularis]PKC74353.1 hypothetical protein RhiirA1_436988 [Rhizophagus irregularis]PKK75774.1 hypothetical protein RhiirC2_845758 [Rhizophagus irregularis]PKY15490.1 hypothetical protein RhiirB3_520448 [Rhizophagus irregularis]|eukprot:XP_025187566.1 hypothetical protein GLOIN_2v1514913 [Rhizophagus irregularis DAOM 181602=DAOM 197198]